MSRAKAADVLPDEKTVEFKLISKSNNTKMVELNRIRKWIFA